MTSGTALPGAPAAGSLSCASGGAFITRAAPGAIEAHNLDERGSTPRPATPTPPKVTLPAGAAAIRTPAQSGGRGSYGLTPRQAEALAFLRRWTGAQGPRLVDLARGLGLKNKCSALALCRHLAERGHIRHVPFVSRGIELVEPVSRAPDGERLRPARTAPDAGTGKPIAAPWTYPFRNHRSCAEWA